jgi:hypothetical protein
MTAHRAAPCSALNFNVHFSGVGAPAVDLGFSEVIFPPFAVMPKGDAPGPTTDGSAGPQTLVLRRGFDGRLDLYRWWDQARRRKAQRGRTVTVQLLGADEHAPVATWRFSQARPVLLAYSPLDALHGGVLVETLTLAFDSMSLR